MTRNHYRLYLIVLCITAGFASKAQPTISGPDCIIPGLTHQYIISGDWTPKSTAKVCITGGKLTTGTNCTADGVLPYMIQVIWNDSSNRRIDLVSSLGNVSLVVTGTTALQGGLIEVPDKARDYVSKNSYTIKCKDATGGHCSPKYMYQWQRSENGLNWKDIEGETKRDLKFSGEISGNTFFRRVTKETRSNTIAYSDMGTLTVRF